MLSQGVEINGYRIEGILGRGGMGVVYEATQLSLDRRVALKVLSTDLSDNDEFRSRFAHEARIQAHFSHPHVVTVHDFGEVEGRLYIVMALVKGQTLKELLRAGEIPPARSLALLGQVAEALDTAHVAGLVHRDVKPQNILIAAEDRAFLADFGLTRLSTETGFTRSGQWVGTLQYIAPEQVSGQPAAAAADIYSLAGVLYECLTGSLPFDRGGDVAVLYAHTNEPPPRPTDVCPDLPPALDEVIVRGMAKDPAERPSSAVELIGAARDALAGQPVNAGSEAGTVVREHSSARPPRAPRRRSGSLIPRTWVPAAESSAPTQRSAAPTQRLAGPLRRTRSQRRAVGLAVGFVCAAIAAGVVAGEAGSGRASTTLRSADSPALSVRYADSAWRRAAATTVAGTPLTGALGLNQGSGGLMLRAGIAQAADPTLIPTALRARLAEPPSSQRVHLGSVQALRYRNLAISGSSSHVSVLAMPTSYGEALVLCTQPGPLSAHDESACETVANTLTLRAGRPVPLAPNPAYAHLLSTVLARFAAARATLLRQLEHAGSPDAQARALARFAPTCDGARRALATVSVGPQELTSHERIVNALSSICAAYAAMGHAAHLNHSSDYASARGEASSAESSLRGGVHALQSLGYHV
jgi:serine/threonine-protein kinase